MRRKSQTHVKRVKAKGREYLYFRTGRKDAAGKEILERLPPAGTAGFGEAYGSLLAARSRRERATETELTVTGLCRLYEASPQFKRLSAGTQRLYGFGLAYFQKMLPTAPAGLLEQKDIALLIDSKASQPGAANSLLRTINAMYKWGRKRGHVANDPGKNLDLFDMGEHQPWPKHALEAGLRSDDELIRLTVHLLYFTALRIGDALALRWSDVREGRIYVTPQKTKRTRGEMVIPVHRDLAAELAQHKPRGLTIVANAAGRPLHQHTVRDKLKAFALAHGAAVVPHGLRKNAVNALLECGCSVAETAAISGQSLAMVEHYAKARAQGDLASAAILRWEGNRK
jgi:integrase